MTNVLLVILFQGPIVGFTFGVIIKNRNLWQISVRNELIGLLICVTFGESLLLVQYCNKACLLRNMLIVCGFVVYLLGERKNSQPLKSLHHLSAEDVFCCNNRGK